MRTILNHLKRNWKQYALAAVIAGASYYGGPAAGHAIRKYLPPAFYDGLVGSASGAETVAEMPQVPTRAPLIRDVSIMCPSGLVYLHIYDIEPGGERAYVVYGALTTDAAGEPVHNPPFAVLIGDSANFDAWLRLPGRGIQKLSQAELRSQYSNPCEILDQIKVSPA